MNDNQKIESCIDMYYEGCCESDPVKIKQAFDENAMISGYLPDGLHEMNLDEFAGFVEAQQPSPKEKGDEALVIVTTTINIAVILPIDSTTTLITILIMIPRVSLLT